MNSFEFNYLDPYRNVKKYSRLRLYFYSRGFDRFKIGLNSMKTRVEAFFFIYCDKNTNIPGEINVSREARRGKSRKA